MATQGTMLICSDRLEKLALQLHGQFLGQRYQRFGWTWNCQNAAGFTQVINLQANPDSDVCSFTVNLGVYVPQINRFQQRVEQRGFVQEAECDFRERLSIIAYQQDRWWQLSDDPLALAEQLLSLLHQAEAWFEQYRDVETIIQTWEHSTHSAEWTRDSELQMVLLFAQCGQDHRARQLLMQLLLRANPHDLSLAPDEDVPIEPEILRLLSRLNRES